MKHSTGNPTKAQSERMEKLREFGCVACHLNGEREKVEAEIHHFLSGNRRIGHDASVPLCPWHHRAAPWFAMTITECLDAYGPSWHQHRRAFRERYGSDTELLAMTNDLIGWNP